MARDVLATFEPDLSIEELEDHAQRGLLPDELRLGDVAHLWATKIDDPPYANLDKSGRDTRDRLSMQYLHVLKEAHTAGMHGHSKGLPPDALGFNIDYDPRRIWDARANRLLTRADFLQWLSINEFELEQNRLLFLWAMPPVKETSAERKARLERWYQEELTKKERGALERTAKREGINRRTLSGILNKGKPAITPAETKTTTRGSRAAPERDSADDWLD